MNQRSDTIFIGPGPLRNGLSGLLLCLLGLSGQTGQATAADAALCSDYAQTAVNMFRSAKAQNCPGLKYPVWSDDFQHHYRWCLTAPVSQVQQGAHRRQQQMQSCGHQGMPRTAGGPAADEVILFEGPDFIGQSAVFRINSGDRWVSGDVNQLPFASIGSVKVGDNVAIAAFNRPNFAGKQIRDPECRATYRKGQNAGDAILVADDDYALHCNWVSFIVFNRNIGLAGVVLQESYVDDRSTFTKFSRFLPVPLKAGQMNACYTGISFTKEAKGQVTGREIGFVDVPASGNRRVTIFSPGKRLPRPARASADLFAAPGCQGQFVRLPGPGNVKSALDLKYNWPHGKILSVRIHWTGPNDAHGTVTSVGTVVQPIMPILQGQAQTADQGTGTAVVTGTIATGNQIGAMDELRGRDVLGIYADRMEFRVHYVLSPAHPMPVYGGAWFKTGTGSAGSYKPVTITKAGLGHFDVTVHRSAGMSDPKAVEFFIYEGGQQPFLSKTFAIE